YTSKPLSDGHWMDEARNLFETSLARIQFDAWNIASGEDQVHEGQDGFVNWTPGEAGNLCGFFKYKAEGYRNINLGAFVGLVLTLPVLWFLSLEVGEVTGAVKSIFCFRQRRSRPIGQETDQTNSTLANLTLQNDAPEERQDRTQ